MESVISLRDLLPSTVPASRITHLTNSCVRGRLTGNWRDLLASTVPSSTITHLTNAVMLIAHLSLPGGVYDKNAGRVCSRREENGRGA